MTAESKAENRPNYVMSIDLDAYYCQVEMRHDRTLSPDEPFAVYQKQIIATCNYAARRCGVKKLVNIWEAKKVCPGIRLVNGESLAKYRREGKELVRFVRSIVNAPLERLGLEEMRIDLTAAVERNLARLQPVVDAVLAAGDGAVPDDPDEAAIELWPSGAGGEPFACDDFWFGLRAKVLPDQHGQSLHDFAHSGQLGLYIAGHIGEYVRERLHVDRGYTSSVGVSTNKTMAKMVGSENKPNGVTVLLPEHVQEYLDPLGIRMIPGFGSVTVHTIERFVLSQNRSPGSLGSSDSGTGSPSKPVVPPRTRNGAGNVSLLGSQALGSADDTSARYMHRTVSVREARTLLSQDDLMRMFNATQGAHLWRLLHGDDDSPVCDADEIPRQVSVEDTYGRLDTAEQVHHALVPLVQSLMQQLLEDCCDDGGSWIKTPTTFTLTVMGGVAGDPYVHRRVRSCPAPSALVDIGRVKLPDGYTPPRLGAIAATIVRTAAMTLFRDLIRQRYNLDVKMLNVGVTNFVDDEALASRQPLASAGAQRRLDSYFRAPKRSSAVS